MKSADKQLLTIPNLLSLLRLLMIPVFVRLYLRDEYGWTAALLILSGLTDVADGFIARRFGQITDIGKVFDPIADKLTQAVMLLCLISRHQVMILPFVLLAVKEVFAAISGLAVINRTGYIPGAEWHGKAATLLLYGMLILHVAWQDIPGWVSNVFIGTCVVMMLFSLMMYAQRNVRAIRSVEENAD